MFADVKVQPDLNRDVFRALHESAFTFYQAGSYYFECARPDSDWDFYVQHDYEVVKYLRDLGFETMGLQDRALLMDGRVTRDEDKIEYIKDDNGSTHSVLEFLAGPKVQVQVLYDVNRMRVVRDRMFEEKADEHLVADRCKRATMWTEMFNSVPPSSHAAADAEAEALFDAASL